MTDGYATPSQDAFELFCAVWTILVVIFLAASARLFDRKLHHPFIVLGLNALTMLFWFAAFIAMAVFHHNLENVDVFDGFDDNVYGVCGLIGSYCPSVEAAAIFGAFEWYVLSRLPDLGICASDVIAVARETFPVSSRYLKHQALRPLLESHQLKEPC